MTDSSLSRNDEGKQSPQEGMRLGAEIVNAVMEAVRLDACGSAKLNHLWVMDSLHEIRRYLYQEANRVPSEKERITPERAADLTAACSDVDFDWKAAPENKYHARLWRGSREYFATGATALEAVLRVHKEAEASE